ncbi:hypothetical protein J6590_035713 [Homalodisca vitripennis]|nr:hypothetical protein J6590_035713 [Homalodisca vitripennis]
MAAKKEGTGLCKRTKLLTAIRRDASPPRRQVALSRGDASMLVSRVSISVQEEKTFPKLSDAISGRAITS